MTALSLYTSKAGDEYRSAVAGRQQVLLPDDVVPLFLFFGDSTAVGMGDTAAGSRTVWETTPGNAYPIQPGDKTNYGQYWDQWLYVQGDNLYIDDRTEGSSGVTMTGTPGWEQVFPHMGGTGGAGSYANDDGPDNRQQAPLWSFSQSIYGLFKTADQNIVAPYFVYFGAGGISTGTNDYNATLNYSPGGLACDIAFDGYLVRAVNNLIAAGKRVAVCGVVSTVGAADILPNIVQANTTSYNLDIIRRYLENKFPDQCSFPWLQLDAYLPDADNYTPPLGGDVTQADVDGLRTEYRTWQKQEPCTRLVDRSGIESNVDGVHFTALGNIQFGRRLGRTYRTLLAEDPLCQAPIITANIS